MQPHLLERKVFMDRIESLKRKSHIYTGCRLACMLFLAIAIVIWFVLYRRDPFGHKQDPYVLYASLIVIITLFLRHKHHKCQRDLELAQRKHGPNRTF